MTGINIMRIEEDAFKNLTSLEAFMISNSDIAELPRIFSNSPMLKTFSLTDSKLSVINENAFTGVPALIQLDLSANNELLELEISNMKSLTTVRLNRCSKLSDINISEMPELTGLGLSTLSAISSVYLENLPSLISLTIQRNSQNTALAMNISNCPNLNTLQASTTNLVSLALDNVDALTDMDLTSNSNLRHTGLNTSLHSILNSEAHISLRGTKVMNLDEFVFRPLIETFTSVDSSSGYIDMRYVDLDCGCDVKWIIEDFHFQTDFFANARCVDGTYLADVDPILLDMMCPP
eukprot:TRINITY_DN31877_c0_g1_i1.p1 TRINITY_DN31877_c0_g1~~TRINITY_DN31877_c0_g1_i1.p1  ORF type:complete len:306 (+),score=56.64 TRINITY_DN31877_c0_g1_i1:40-918(+)